MQVVGTTVRYVSKLLSKTSAGAPRLYSVIKEPECTMTAPIPGNEEYVEEIWYNAQGAACSVSFGELMGARLGVNVRDDCRKQMVVGREPFGCRVCLGETSEPRYLVLIVAAYRVSPSATKGVVRFVTEVARLDALVISVNAVTDINARGYRPNSTTQSSPSNALPPCTATSTPCFHKHLVLPAMRR